MDTPRYGHINVSPLSLKIAERKDFGIKRIVPQLRVDLNGMSNHRRKHGPITRYYEEAVLSNANPFARDDRNLQGKNLRRNRSLVNSPIRVSKLKSTIF